MVTNEVRNAFGRALDELNVYNTMVYDYWVSELCEDDGEFISLDDSKLTVENLALIQKDVRQQLALMGG